MPAGPRDKQQFKHTVAFNEGQVPKPADEFVACMPLFATRFPSPVPQPDLSVYFSSRLTVTNSFCMVNISVFACLVSFRFFLCLFALRCQAIFDFKAVL